MTTPRNIKASVINDLRTYAIHRKHMEKSEMSEVKDYGEMKPFFFYKNGHLDGESPSPIWGENENHAWNTHLEDLGGSREELEGEGYTLIEYRALAGRDPEKLDALLEAAKALFEDSVARTQSRCAIYGEDYGKGTDAEEAFRSALAAFEGGNDE